MLITPQRVNSVLCGKNNFKTISFFVFAFIFTRCLQVLCKAAKQKSSYNYLKFAH